MPILVVIPGIAAYVIVNDPDLFKSVSGINMDLSPLAKPDNTYPWLLGLLPKGIKGLAFAALAAAIVSSLASMINSTATIFTLDIYKPYINKKASEKHYVICGVEFGIENVGKRALIVRVLYGGKCVGRDF